MTKAYLVEFKNKYTRNKWVAQKILHSTKASANRTASYMRKQHDPKGVLVKTKTRITLVDPLKSKKPVIKF